MPRPSNTPARGRRRGAIQRPTIDSIVAREIAASAARPPRFATSRLAATRGSPPPDGILAPCLVHPTLLHAAHAEGRSNGLRLILSWPARSLLRLRVPPALRRRGSQPREVAHLQTASSLHASSIQHSCTPPTPRGDPTAYD